MHESHRTFVVGKSRSYQKKKTINFYQFTIHHQHSKPFSCQQQYVLGIAIERSLLSKKRANCCYDALNNCRSDSTKALSGLCRTK